MHKRALTNQIIPLLKHKNAIVITGMRQVGKTTLMKQISENWKGPQIWFDFDNPLDLILFENPDYNAIYEDLKTNVNATNNQRLLVCIDEIQNYPEITKIIKYLIDHYNVKFILTGSSNYYLRNLFPESLSGRKFLFILHPLSYREFLYFKEKIPEKHLQPDSKVFSAKQSMVNVLKLKNMYEEYIEFGGFPEVVLTLDKNIKKMILKNIFASFFEKDIKVFSELKDIRELRDLIILLVPRTGNTLDVTRLASELGINRVKAYAYLEFLQGTFFIKLLSKFTSSIDRSVAGGKKLYFSDTGLLNIIGKVNEGQLFETAVGNQLQHYGELSFYNKRNSSEIDFILNNEIAIEVKNKAIDPDMARLSKTAQNISISNHLIISKTPVQMENVVYPWFL